MPKEVNRIKMLEVTKRMITEPLASNGKEDGRKRNQNRVLKSPMERKRS